ncbi:MAG: monovalent cation/H(+) antiporter subunit G [Nevskiales bacterium]
MLATTLDILSWFCLLAGGCFAVIGGIGMHRLSDFFARSHAASITDTGGAGLIIVGLLLQASDWIVAIKLLMILLFMWFTGPTASHILAQAALSDGLKPQARRLGKDKA